MTASENGKMVKKALQKVLDGTPDLLHPMFLSMARDFVKTAIKEKSFTSFTGNTITSISAGVYQKGILTDVIQANDTMKSPLMVKIMKGQFVYLDEPYEGESRGVKGRVELNKEFGFETSMKFLQDFKISSKVPLALVVTTGTEYSDWLGDFMIDTWLAAPSILKNNFKLIK